MNDRVFISYARVDGGEFARAVRDRLEENHIRTWLDERDISPGARWPQSVDAGLKAARAVVVVLTPGAVASPQVESEWSYAMRLGTPIIPILVKSCDVPSALCTREWIDAIQDQATAIRQLCDHFLSPGARHRDELPSAPDERKQAVRHTRVIGQRLLSIAADHFKDRRAEQEEIHHLLGNPATRIVCIVGRGGLGKTALAYKVLADIEQGTQRVDGIVYASAKTGGLSLERIFFDCAAVLDPAREAALTAVWTEPNRQQQDKIHALIETTREGTYIVLLDNTESVLDSSGRMLDESLRALLDTALRARTGLRFVLTSRIPLAFEPDTLHLDRRIVLDDGLPVEDGIKLLRDLDPGGHHGLKSEPDAVLAEAVKCVHGVPRALELLANILARDRFANLNDVLPGFLRREDIVKALIEESYRRLDADARRVLEALSVFDRPVPVKALDYLLQPFCPDLKVPGIVNQLALTHIVTADRTLKTVRLHPIDRDYAYGRIPEEATAGGSYTRRAIHRRAAEYYESISPPSEQWQSLADLNPKLTAFEHYLKAGDFDAAAGLLDEVDEDHLSVWGHAERTLSMHQALVANLKEPVARIKNLVGIGSACDFLGRYDEAIDAYTLALALARAQQDRVLETKVLIHLAVVYENVGGYELTLTHGEEALAIARELGNTEDQAMALGHVGIAHDSMGHFEQMLACYQEALEISKKDDDRWGESNWLGNIGDGYCSLGRYREAVEHHQRALAKGRELGYRYGEAFDLRNLGVAQMGLGELEAASESFRRAVRLADEARSNEMQQRSRYHLAQAQLHLGLMDAALNTVSECRKYSYRPCNHSAAVLQGLIFARLGRDAEARAACVDAEHLANQLLESSRSHFGASYTLALAKAVMAALSRDEERTARTAEAKTAYLIESDHAR